MLVLHNEVSSCVISRNEFDKFNIKSTLDEFNIKRKLKPSLIAFRSYIKSIGVPDGKVNAEVKYNNRCLAEEICVDEFEFMT